MLTSDPYTALCGVFFFFSTNGTGTTIHTRGRGGTLIHSICKDSLKIGYRYKLKSKIINLKEHMGVNLCDLGLGEDFLDMTQNAQSM